MGIPHLSRAALCCVVALGVLAPVHSSDRGYMEAWPLVLTTRTFRIRIPAARAQPAKLTLQVRVAPSAAGEVRTLVTEAVWQDVQWPEDVWKQAGMPTDSKPQGAWIAEVPIDPSPPGEYRIAAEVTDPASLRGRRFQAQPVVLHAQPDWLHANAGIEGLDTVPRPWPPVGIGQAGGGLVLWCWNRRTELSNGGALVGAITSGPENVLAAPITLLVQDADARRLQPAGPWELVERRRTHVTARRTFGAGDSTAQVTLTQEFDGFTWLRVDLRSGPGISKLQVSIPLNPQVAQLIYYYPDYPWYWGNIKNVIKVPRPSLGWTGSFRNWFYIGSLSAGLFWWSDSREKWDNPDEPDTIQILSDAQKVEVRLHVLKGNAPVQARTFEFGLQATPVKPWPAEPLHNKVSTFNWDAGSALDLLDELQQAGYEVIHLSEWWTTEWGGTTPRDPEGLRRLVEEAHRRGMQVIVYFGFEADETTEAFRKYPWETVGGDPRLAPFRPDRFYPPERFDESLPPRRAFDNDRAGPELERLLAGMKALLTEYHIDGFYLDGTQLPCGGAGDLRRARELMKRMRYLVDTHGTRGVIYAHTSAFNIIPVNGFADVVFNGEQLWEAGHLELGEAGPLGGSLPQDYLFLLMNGHPWGVPHDLCQDRVEYVDFARLLDTGTDTYQWSGERWPIRKVWLEADLWHAQYTPPHIAGSRWPDRPRDVYVAFYLSNGGLYTVIVYSAQASPVQVKLPVRAILGLGQGRELSAPTVVYARSPAEWRATADGWEGTVPSGQAVILQARVR